MRAHDWLWLVAGAIGLGLAPGLAAAQVRREDPSARHVTVPPAPGYGSNPEEILAQRLRRLRGQADADRLIELLKKNPELARRLAEQFQKNGQADKLPNQFDLVNPRFQEMVRRAVEEGRLQPPGADGMPNPESLQELGRIVEDSRRGPELPASEAPLADPQGAGPGTAPMPRDLTPPGAMPDAAGALTPPQMAQAEQLPFQRELTRRFLDAAERLQDIDSPLADSPAVERALRELNRGTIDRAGDGWLNLGRSQEWVPDMSGLGKYAPDMERFRPSGDWPLGGLSNLSLPRFGWPGRALPSVGLPSLGGVPSAPSTPNMGGGDGLQVFLWIALLLLAGFLVWRLLGRRIEAAAGRALQGWRLGPWPVRPAAVATRDELVRAFEYLSLLRLGPPARHFNHQEVAGKLGSGDDRTHWSAVQLAGVYERAKYAPPDETLTAADLAAARRDLCHLAGVGSE